MIPEFLLWTQSGISFTSLTQELRCNKLHLAAKLGVSLFMPTKKLVKYVQLCEHKLQSLKCM